MTGGNTIPCLSSGLWSRHTPYSACTGVWPLTRLSRSPLKREAGFLSELSQSWFLSLLLLLWSWFSVLIRLWGGLCPGWDSSDKVHLFGHVEQRNTRLLNECMQRHNQLKRKHTWEDDLVQNCWFYFMLILLLNVIYSTLTPPAGQGELQPSTLRFNGSHTNYDLWYLRPPGSGWTAQLWLPVSFHHTDSELHVIIVFDRTCLCVLYDTCDGYCFIKRQISLKQDSNHVRGSVRRFFFPLNVNDDNILTFSVYKPKWHAKGWKKRVLNILYLQSNHSSFWEGHESVHHYFADSVSHKTTKENLITALEEKTFSSEN